MIDLYNELPILEDCKYILYTCLVEDVSNSDKEDILTST